MKGLTFDADLVDALLDGRKTATVRYDLDQNLSPGDRVACRSDLRLDSDEAFAWATVADVVQTDLGDALDAVDDRGYQHNAGSVSDLWVSLNDYYDDLGLSTPVSVVLLDDVRPPGEGAVVLSPEEAREVADELADYDITAQLSDKEDGRPEEAVEWGRELRHRARDARDDG